MSSARVLVVDDEDAVREAFAALLSRRGFQVTAFADAQNAKAVIARGACDLILTSLKLSDGSWVDILREAQAHDPTLPVLVVSGHAQMEVAVEAMRQGARDFLPTPVAPDELVVRVEGALTHRDLLREIRTLRREPRAVRKSDILIGESLAIERVRAQIQAVARPPVMVLVLGESGTGKELVARTLHATSPRASGPFVVINCGAIPESLLENELFGHVRGAYTGANTDTKGVFERAHEGTLFLDEIGEMSPQLQVRLLRVIETGEFQRLGGARSIRADVRIVAATHRDLAKMVREGSFREDLYYRINVVTIRLPPLRERKEDIALLAEHFRRTAQKELDIDSHGFSPGTLEQMMRYDWPGNIRELANFVRRALLNAQSGWVGAEGLPSAAEPEVQLDFARPFVELKREVVDRFERAYLHQLLTSTQGNVARAARVSGQYSKNLWDLFKKHGIDLEAYRARGSSRD